MAVNIFTDRMQHAELFGKPVLTTNWLIPRETVPDRWYCYDIQGTDRDPGAHAALVDCAAVNHSGTVLSPAPLKRPATAVREIGKRDYFLHGEEMYLEGFCEEYELDCPENPIKFETRPAFPDEAGSFYALPQMGLTAKGLEMLQAAADPGRPHGYRWYVIENINDCETRRYHELPLEEAIQLYAGLDCADKRLGVTKDDIASVDLVILHDGREWISEDYRKSDSFAQDPMVAGAVEQIRQTLEGQTVGRISFANGELICFTDPQKYLEAIREELPYHPATGFRYETLTSDPEIRRSVDAELCDLYDIETPEGTGEEQQDMAMGGL